MEYEFKITVSPKFSTAEIISDIITKNWFEFQSKLCDLGNFTLSYIQEYINSHVHRSDNTGNLADSIKLYNFGGLGEASVGWGIGKMSEMDKLAPYWYLINYGGFTVASRSGWTIPGWFGNGHQADPAMRGSGVGTERFNYRPDVRGGGFAMKPTSPIQPMNYIESTRLHLDRQINNTIKKLRGIK